MKCCSKNSAPRHAANGAAGQRPVVANRIMSLRVAAATLSGDIRINLLALDRWCHDRAHVGKISRKQLLAIIARREQRPAEEIELEILRLRWAPKCKQVVQALALRDRRTTHTRTKLGRAL
jgi:hypothetical protein